MFRSTSHETAQQSQERRLADSNRCINPLEVQRDDDRESYNLRVAAELVTAARALGGSQTNVYFIQAGVGGPIKVGVARDPYSRLADLQTGNPERLILRGFYPAPQSLERVIHAAFADDRLEGEWFAGTERLEDLADTLYDAAIQHGLIVAA